jgi:hypothetical protein
VSTTDRPGLLDAPPRHPAATNGTVHIVEPAAKDLMGHYFQFAAEAARYFAREGFDVAVHASGDADLATLRDTLPGTEIVAAFAYRQSAAYAQVRAGRMTPADPLIRRVVRQQIIPRLRHVPRVLGITDPVRARNIEVMLDASARGIAARFGASTAEHQTRAIASAEFRRLFARMRDAGGRHHLFIASPEFFVLQALIDAIREGVGAAIASLHIRFWHFRSGESQGADLLPMARELALLARDRGVKAFWYCDVPWAQAHLQARLHCPVGYLDFKAFASVAAEHAAPAAADVRHLLFPGAHRRVPDKGVQFIASLAEILPKSGPLRIRMQAIPDGMFDTERERLHASGMVDFLPAVLPPADYLMALQDCAAIALPYDATTWFDRFRGSGVLLEALLHAKPLFVRRGLPLLNYRTQYDFATFASPAELLASVTRVLDGSHTLDVAGNRRRYRERLAVNDMLQNLRQLVGRDTA